MNKNDVIAFFDRYAAQWDADQIDKTPIIHRIFDNAGICAGQDVLDVACGTGVLFPYYLERKVQSVTGIDISPEMAKLAEQKHKDIENIRVICGDVEEASFDRKFDAVMVYNAFPHFPNPERLIATLWTLIKDGGSLTIAHGASRKAIDNHHSGAASKVSNGLMSAESLKQLFAPYFDVEIMVSTWEMYQVTGVKKPEAPYPHSHGGHRHSHPHAEHDHHHHSGNGVPMEELVALMKYMVGHNEAHAEELAQLAQQLEEAGNRNAYRRVMDAVVNFDVGNATLAAVLDELTRTEE